MFRFGYSAEVKEALYASDRHFYHVFSLYYENKQKAAIMYMRHNMQDVAMMDAKKIINDTVHTYDESYIKNRLKYIEEQSPEAII